MGFLPLFEYKEIIVSQFPVKVKAVIGVSQRKFFQGFNNEKTLHICNINLERILKGRCL